jgi:Tol biopolymer transport system component/DNA-binding winged helix-turn-helix (wHTH) protein
MSFESLKDDLKNPEDAGNGLKSSYSGFYEFGDFRLDAAKRLLLREGVVVPLTPKAFDVLLLLVSRQGHVVSKEELMNRVWPDTIVEENNLNVNVSLLRKTLGEKPNDHQFIVTVPGLGYQFVAEVRSVGGENGGAEARSRKTSNSAFSPPRHFLLRHETETHAAKATAPMSSAEFFRSEIKRHKRSVVVAFAASAVALAGIGFELYKFIGSNRSVGSPTAALQKIKLAKLTGTGKAIHAAITPDGRYLVHVVANAGQQSLWLRQVATTSDKEIVPPSNYEYGGLTFSHDGNYLYYTGGRKVQQYGELYRMPILGGTARKLIEDIDSPISLSPDDKRLAFVRGYPSETESDLIVANADGSGEQRLARRKGGAFTGPAWSPDGKELAWVNESDGGGMSVFGVRVEDGAQTLLTSRTWFQIGRLAWLSDGAGLIMTAAEQESAPQQVWHLSYPGGEARRITNDLSNYQDVTLTADCTVLVTVLFDQLSNVWTTAPSVEENRAAQVSSNNSDGLGGISWTPDGEIVYASNVSGNEDIWIVGADGKNQRQLTTDTGRNYDPAVSSDGRYIVFVSDRTGPENLWRMEIDGSNQRLLTNNGAGRPNCSPDGRWVVFASADSAGNPRISRVSIDGGSPVQLTNHTSGRPVISPDGKQIVCGYFDDSDEQNSRWKYALIPFEGGEPIKMFEIPPTVPFSARFIWSLDGRLTYIDQRNGVSNIWSQPIDGSPPKQLTKFKSGRIFQFAWSRDGKWLALARGAVTSDVVLISDFR